MLPGFRFLFAAIILSTSILVFGLGAAALLRAAHEEFASAPAWQPAPETRFAEARDAAKEAAKPVLALLQVDAAPKIEAPASAQHSGDTAPTEPAATPATRQIAALPQPDSSPVDAANTEAPAADTRLAESPAVENAVSASSPPESAASASEAAPAPAPTSTAADETKLVATAPTALPAAESIAPVAAEATPAVPEQVSESNPAAPALSEASKTIATLGGPAVTIALATPEKPAAAKSDKSAQKKNQQARRAMARHRAAVRAAHHASRQPVDMFGQPVTR
jgi:hypothetical protein